MTVQKSGNTQCTDKEMVPNLIQTQSRSSVQTSRSFLPTQRPLDNTKEISSPSSFEATSERFNEKVEDPNHDSNAVVQKYGNKSQKSCGKSVVIKLFPEPPKQRISKKITAEQAPRSENGKKTEKKDVSSAYSLEGFNNTDDSLSSKNGSEGGYAGSASSNEDSNETNKQAKRANEDEKSKNSFGPTSSCSSELADFSYTGSSDNGSGCSTFMSCSDLSQDRRHESTTSAQHLQPDKNTVPTNAPSNKTNDLHQDNEDSDASLNSSSSLKAVAPECEERSKASSTSSNIYTEGKEKKTIDFSSRNYIVSFKKQHKRSYPSKLKDHTDDSSSSNSNTTSVSTYNNDTTSESITSNADQHITKKHKRNQFKVLPLKQTNDANEKQNDKQTDQFLSKMLKLLHREKLVAINALSDKRKDGKRVRTTVKKSNKNRFNKSPIYEIGPDIMAQILSFLPHTETFSFLTMPLSKRWCETYTKPQDLWKILCVSSPFCVKLNSNKVVGYGKTQRSRSIYSDSSSCSRYTRCSDLSEDSLATFPPCKELKVKHMFGVYRLLYYSFVKCIRYLDRIKEDSLKGRTPKGMKVNDFLQSHEKIAARVRGDELLETGACSRESFACKKEGGSVAASLAFGDKKKIMEVGTKSAAISKSNTSQEGKDDKENSKSLVSQKQKIKPKFSPSKLTQRLLGATKTGNAGPVNLPWSCAIYSVINWMVAFNDVLGIQTMCLNVLPCLLEDEHQRTTAQHARLADRVLKVMILFPRNVELHIAAFHAIVLLARPLGGREGMLFHQTMVGKSSDMLNMDASSQSKCCKNGIAVMLESMRRFQTNERLQAMSCWSIVNIALIAAQKTMLVKLGGISVAANAMMQHPMSAEVQFRALFALINLSIPCSTKTQPGPTSPTSNLVEILSEVSEKEILDESVGQVSNLVVVAMKNFCSNEAVMNRACLVLHNLSLNDQYHTTLLWTPNCYQMLEWAMGNYRYDQVLQQSASGTLQRLQRTLRNNYDLFRRFSMFIRSQQQSSREISKGKT